VELRRSLVDGHTTSWNLDTLEEVFALYTRLITVPSWCEVGLAWQGLSFFSAALEASLDALGALWAATFSAAWYTGLTCARHWDLVIATNSDV